MFRPNVTRLGALLALVVALACPPAATAQQDGPATTLRDRLTALMGPAGAASGAYVAQVGTGAEVFASRADVPRIPASVQKLYTTSAALRRFGPDDRLLTTVVGTGTIDGDGAYRGDLVLRGAGDPTFGSESFTRRAYGGGMATVQDLAGDLAAHGIRRIEGRILGDESAFDALRGVPDSGLRRISPYVGPLSGLDYNRGLAAESGSAYQSDPPSFAAERLREALRARGVMVRGASAAGVAPPGASELARDESPPVRVLARLTNRPSDNHLAEMLLKDLGSRFGGAGSTTAGASVANAAAAEAGAEPRVVDGSGLSRANQTTPHDVVDLLLANAGDRAFTGSLAVAGRQGTLRTRMRGTAAAGRCRAKTGTLSNVSGLAGYCATASGGTVAFAVLMNAVSPSGARAIQDRIAAELARSA